MSEEKKQQGIEIQLDEQVGQGHYSNLAIIAHSPSEFIIDLPFGDVGKSFLHVLLIL